MSKEQFEEIAKRLEDFWAQPLTKQKTRIRKDFYTVDYILGFNMSLVKLIERRVINKTILIDFLNNFDN